VRVEKYRSRAKKSSDDKQLRDARRGAIGSALVREFRAVLADPPWNFRVWSAKGMAAGGPGWEPKRSRLREDGAS